MTHIKNGLFNLEDLDITQNEHCRYRPTFINLKHLLDDTHLEILECFILGKIRDKYSISTIKRDTSYVVIFLNYLTEYKLTFKDIDNKQFRAFIIYLKQKFKSLMPTQNRLFNIAKSFVDFLKSEDVINHDIEISQKFPYTRIRKMPLIYNKPEVTIIMNSLNQGDNSVACLMIRVAMLTAFRSSDIVTLKKANLIKKNDKFIIRKSQIKTNNLILHEIDEDLFLSLLEFYNNESSPNNVNNYIFFKNNDIYPPTVVIRLLNKYSIQNNLYYKGKLIEIRFHKIRKTISSLMANSGANTEQLVSFLGHKDGGVLHHYCKIMTHTTQKELRKLINKYSGLVDISNGKFKKVDSLKNDFMPLFNGSCGDTSNDEQCNTFFSCIKCASFVPSINSIEGFKNYLKKIEREIIILERLKETGRLAQLSYMFREVNQIVCRLNQNFLISEENVNV